MKKTALISICLLAAASMSAQQTVVKEAEQAMKSKKPYAEVLKIITPAMSDPSTDKLAITYYIPGKAGIQQYDDLLGKQQLGMAGEDAPATMANALLGAYDNYMKALPYDSLPDAKGKVKPKYSKEIINSLAGHYNDFNNMAINFWNAKQYKDAYRSWGIYLEMPNDPRFKGKISVVPADTVVAEVYYNQGLAAWQADDFEDAINAFRKAIKSGYNKKSIYEYAIAVATLGKNNEALLEFASAGNKAFGADDPQFLNQIINYYLQTEKYAEALDYLNKGIAENPNNSQYYALRGIIEDNQEKRDEANADYRKAIELNPENGLALFYLGRSVASKAGSMSDAYEGANFDKYKNETLVPMYKESVKYLEKAYELDPNNRPETLRVLEVVYYNLNDEAGMKSVQDRKLAD